MATLREGHQGIRGVSIETMQQAWSYSVNNFWGICIEVLERSPKMQD